MQGNHFVVEMVVKFNCVVYNNNNRVVQRKDDWK